MIRETKGTGLKKEMYKMQMETGLQTFIFGNKKGRPFCFRGEGFEKMDEWKKLEETLGYKFKNLELLKNAFMHTSYVHEAGGNKKSNERLEFLGDTVLNIAISEKIFKHVPEISEGNMSKIRATVICEDALYEAALILQYDKYIQLGKGEEKLGGRKKPSILSDAFEAVIAAIYLDSDFETARSFVLNNLGEKAETEISLVGQKDHKTKLQEILQKNSTGKIIYETVSESGPDHMKKYMVVVKQGDKVLGKGIGSSKKDAEQEAASEALKKISEKK